MQPSSHKIAIWFKMGLGPHFMHHIEDSWTMGLIIPEYTLSVSLVVVYQLQKQTIFWDSGSQWDWAPILNT